MPRIQLLPFHKIHGAGNDFIALDTIQNPHLLALDWPQIALKLCERNRGIGADGLLALENSGDTGVVGENLRMRMWNPDGTEDMCGNGLRCLAALAVRQNYVSNQQFPMQTLAGTRLIRRLPGGELECEMGTPDFSPSAIPARAVPARAIPARGEDNLVDYALEVEGRRLENLTSVSTGSTHTVVFLGGPLSQEQFQFFGPRLEHHPLFPARTSVMFAFQTGRAEFQIRIWERGVGETLACGTGACAVAASAWKTGRAEGTVAVHSGGGTLWARQEGAAIWLAGPTKFVFQGEFLC